MKRYGFIMIVISTLLWWGWLSTPIVGVASTADSPATIRFDGKTEPSNQGAGNKQIHVTETSKSSSTVTPESDNKQSVQHQGFGWLPQTSEQWWLGAFIGGIGLLVILISWQLIIYLKKRSSLL
ncbi:hypothetical protein [Lactiplantibacillus herbarum]|uniref:hypothetical protein n=1 Tax=Lactiplantibacillus herbarum TaxID=1670446 RepID=UPI00064E3C85|nr:hypothetical protein [Lactiplantibacillus herbarum]